MWKFQHVWLSIRYQPKRQWQGVHLLVLKHPPIHLTGTQLGHSLWKLYMIKMFPKGGLFLSIKCTVSLSFFFQISYSFAMGQSFPPMRIMEWSMNEQITACHCHQCPWKVFILYVCMPKFKIQIDFLVFCKTQKAKTTITSCYWSIIRCNVSYTELIFTWKQCGKTLKQ